MVADGFFQTQGYGATTISQIAKTSKITEATIYNHFVNKEDLLFAVAQKYLNEFCDSLERHLLGIEGAYAKLAKIIWHHLMFMEDNPGLAKLYVLNILSNIKFYKSNRVDSAKRYLTIIRRILNEGIEEGVFHKDLDIILYQWVITGTINEITLSQIVKERPIKVLFKGDALVNTLTRIVSPDSNEEAGGFGKRKKILLAALDEFGKNGYSSTTISHISSHAGITDPTVYEYFENKEDILMSIPTLATEELFSDLNIDLENIHNPKNALKLYICNQVESYDAYPSYSNVLITELRCNPNFYKSNGYNTIRKYVNTFETIIKWGIEVGDFREDLDIDVVKYMYFGTLDNLIISRATGSKKPTDVFFAFSKMILKVLKQ